MRGTLLDGDEGFSEPISDATHRFDAAGEFAEFLAQRSDVDVNGSAREDDISTVDGRDDLIAGANESGALRQVIQNPELGSRRLSAAVFCSSNLRRRTARTRAIRIRGLNGLTT